jgi:sulfoacetaldehyde dehydrogenase
MPTGPMPEPSAIALAPIKTFVDRARRAQAVAAHWDQRRVDEVVAAVGWYGYHAPHAELLARMGAEETAMGNAEHTKARLRTRVLGMLRDLADARSVGIVETDSDKGLRKVARPIGLIAVATAATAPAAAVFCNALPMLKTRNAVIISANPRAANTAAQAVEFIREALARVGAPVDLVQALPDPDRDRVSELMAAADMVVAAGGPGTVHRAYRSGRPAHGAGVGNSVVIVDETANLVAAAALIAQGKTFDHGTSCSSESSVLIERSRHEALLDLLQQHGGHVCTAAETERLGARLWDPQGVLQRELVGRSAMQIARAAEIEIELGARFLVAPRSLSEADDDFYACEKLAPVLAVWPYEHFEDAVEAVVRFTRRSGRGHSCGIHTARTERGLLLAERCEVSRVMVNQSTGFGNSGSFDNGMPFTTTISCGSWGGSSVSENLGWRHFLNYTWISDPLPRVEPDPAVLFGPCLDRFGELPR